MQRFNLTGREFILDQAGHALDTLRRVGRKFDAAFFSNTYATCIAQLVGDWLKPDAAFFILCEPPAWQYCHDLYKSALRGIDCQLYNRPIIYARKWPFPRCNAPSKFPQESYGTVLFGVKGKRKLLRPFNDFFDLGTIETLPQQFYFNLLSPFVRPDDWVFSTDITIPFAHACKILQCNAVGQDTIFGGIGQELERMQGDLSIHF